MSTEVYGKHYEELTAKQQEYILEIIALKSLDADEQQAEIDAAQR